MWGLAGSEIWRELIRVAYVTVYDARDRRNWSGLGHAIMQALIDQGIEIKSVGPLATAYRVLWRLKGAVYGRLLHQGYEHGRENGCAAGTRAKSRKNSLAGTMT
jgi:hypothetical protein